MIDFEKKKNRFVLIGNTEDFKKLDGTGGSFTFPPGMISDAL